MLYPEAWRFYCVNRPDDRLPWSRHFECQTPGVNRSKVARPSKFESHLYLYSNTSITERTSLSRLAAPLQLDESISVRKILNPIEALKITEAWTLVARKLVVVSSTLLKSINQFRKKIWSITWLYGSKDHAVKTVFDEVGGRRDRALEFDLIGFRCI